LCKDYGSSLNRAIFSYRDLHHGKWPDLIIVTPPFYSEILPYLSIRQTRRYREELFIGLPVVEILRDIPEFYLAERKQIYSPSEKDKVFIQSEE
jgi:hypothetical protein